MIEKYTHLIWDFNGTLFCDMQAGIDSTNILLSQRGLAQIPNIEIYRELFDFPVEDYYRRLGFDFEKEPYDALAKIWAELYLERSKTAGISDGVKQVLEEARRLGVKQTVLSAGEREMLAFLLSELGIKNYFDEIIGLDNVNAKGKVSLAEDWRRKNPDARALMIGDTLHDAMTARAMKADCLLYSGGHQSKKRLLSDGFPVIDSLLEIIDL